MKRFSFLALGALAVLLLGAVPGFCDRLRGIFLAEYGTTSSTFGLAAYFPDGVTPYFSVPAQSNSSSDLILSGIVEYVPVRRWPLELGLALKASFGFSSWNLGNSTVGVYDSQFGTYDSPDQIHIGGNWWAFAGMGTAHLHLGPFVTLDGAIGYGPYGYVGMNYYDDLGLVTGSVVQESSVFPKNAWGIDWSAGMSFGLFPVIALVVDVGMMGPDFVAGLGVGFSL